jgi:hypothetical protein
MKRLIVGTFEILSRQSVGGTATTSAHVRSDQLLAAFADRGQRAADCPADCPTAIRVRRNPFIHAASRDREQLFKTGAVV